MWTIVTTLESTLVVTAVGLVVDFLRNLGPRLIFSTTTTIPVRIANKSNYVGAYELKVRNDSRKKAEEITLHLRAGSASLRVEDYSAPAGLKLVSETDDEGIKIPLAYLKPADMLRLLVVAEGSYVPKSLDVTISSPNKIAAKSVKDVESGRPFLRFTFGAFFGIVAIFLIFYAGRASYLMESSTAQAFELNRRQIMVSAAADSGPPNLAISFATTDDPTYYEGGDLAYSLAAASSKPGEIEKYRRFLSLTLGTATAMAPESQANLLYSLGKIDILLSDENSASNDFKSSIAKSRSTVEFRLRSDPKTREFLIKKGLM
jgi:hypothetical protein